MKKKDEENVQLLNQSSEEEDSTYQETQLVSSGRSTSTERRKGKKKVRLVIDSDSDNEATGQNSRSKNKNYNRVPLFRRVVAFFDLEQLDSRTKFKYSVWFTFGLLCLLILSNMKSGGNSEAATGEENPNDPNLIDIQYIPEYDIIDEIEDQQPELPPFEIDGEYIKTGKHKYKGNSKGKKGKKNRNKLNQLKKTESYGDQATGYMSDLSQALNDPPGVIKMPKKVTTILPTTVATTIQTTTLPITTTKDPKLIAKLEKLKQRLRQIEMKRRASQQNDPVASQIAIDVVAHEKLTTAPTVITSTQEMDLFDELEAHGVTDKVEVVTTTETTTTKVATTTEIITTLPPVTVPVTTLKPFQNDLEQNIPEIPDLSKFLSQMTGVKHVATTKKPQLIVPEDDDFNLDDFIIDLESEENFDINNKFSDYQPGDSYLDVNNRRVAQLRQTCDIMSKTPDISFMTVNLIDSGTRMSRKNLIFRNRFNIGTNFYETDHEDRFRSFWRSEQDWMMCLPPKHGISNILRMLVAAKKHLHDPSEVPWNDNLYNLIKNVGDGTSGVNDMITKIRHKIKTKAILVRHPIEKLYSAWKDKFRTDNKHYHIYKQTAEEILLKFQNQYPAPPFYGVSFADFISYWLDVYKNGNEVQFDGHFRSQFYTCLPCSIDYQYVIKTETLTEDTKYFIKLLFPDSDLNILPHYKATEESTLSVKEQDMYKWLPEEHIRDLHHIFKWECEMLGYDFYEFFYTDNPDLLVSA